MPGPTARDLTGTTFGEWTVLGQSMRSGKHIRWRCRCSCGIEKDVLGFILTSGQSSSCGHGRKYDLTGRVFGKWLVLGAATKRLTRVQWWLCRCDCGTEREVIQSSLTAGVSASCGCTIGLSAKKRLTKHGMADSKPHMVWCTMHQRCRNPRNKAFRNYGGRGIRICERWMDFAAFWADMGPTYREGLTIERVDVNGNYEPGNCTWVLPSEQSKNRRPYSEWKYSNEGTITSRSISS